MKKFNAGWYVIYTRPRHEKKVATELSDGAITYYLPVKKELRKWHDRNKVVDVPLFQSYIFVHLNTLHDYYEGLKIDGVLNYVRTGKEMAQVHNKVIEDIRLMMEYGEEVEVSSDYYQPGQQLMIRYGPLTGMECEVVQTDKKQKILVRVHLLQRNLLVGLPADHFITNHAATEKLMY
ncbi:MULTISPECIES: UpxY family transcription antiterminator [Niastella]|uniref:UpxY family transcription antiterminator n=1 Tax=Niastella soli TaxID=2821487 RepID=A0ABS3Z753_9BACT|nr:UpxY family transcription antiterminator [Niastella soli]MBO9205525.1 UpxY family transcription antiterminator [Niastella soli]